MRISFLIAWEPSILVAPLFCGTGSLHYTWQKSVAAPSSVFWGLPQEVLRTLCGAVQTLPPICMHALSYMSSS